MSLHKLLGLRDLDHNTLFLLRKALDAERRERHDEGDALRQRVSELEGHLAQQAASAAEELQAVQRQLAASARRANDMQASTARHAVVAIALAGSASGGWQTRSERGIRYVKSAC